MYNIFYIHTYIYTYIRAYTLGRRYSIKLIGINWSHIKNRSEEVTAYIHTYIHTYIFRIQNHLITLV